MAALSTPSYAPLLSSKKIQRKCDYMRKMKPSAFATASSNFKQKAAMCTAAANGPNPHGVKRGGYSSQSIQIEITMKEELSKVHSNLIEAADGTIEVVRDSAGALSVYRDTFEKIIEIVRVTPAVSQYSDALIQIKNAYETAFVNDNERRMAESYRRIRLLEKRVADAEEMNRRYESKAVGSALELQNTLTELRRTQERLNHYIRPNDKEAQNRTLEDIKLQTEAIESYARKLAFEDTRKADTDDENVDTIMKKIATMDPSTALKKQRDAGIFGKINDTLTAEFIETDRVRKYKRKNAKLHRKIAQLNAKMQFVAGWLPSDDYRTPLQNEGGRGGGEEEEVSFQGIVRGIVGLQRWKRRSLAKPASESSDDNNEVMSVSDGSVSEDSQIGNMPTTFGEYLQQVKSSAKADVENMINPRKVDSIAAPVVDTAEEALHAMLQRQDSRVKVKETPVVRRRRLGDNSESPADEHIFSPLPNHIPAVAAPRPPPFPLTAQPMAGVADGDPPSPDTAASHPRPLSRASSEAGLFGKQPSWRRLDFGVNLDSPGNEGHSLAR